MGRATSGFATLPASDPSLGFGKERVQIKMVALYYLLFDYSPIDEQK